MSSRPSSFMLTAPGPLRLYSTSELLKLPPPEWLIHDIMPVGGLVGLYGPPWTGKSFVAIDMAMSVATGQPWQGHESRRGYGLYVSAEGGRGMGIRAHAWLVEHGIASTQPNMAWLTESIPVYKNSQDMDILMGRLTDEIDERPAVIVIDTLARCFDGNENEQEDMGRFIGGVDQLRREFESTVIIVHHTRLSADRERGNTSFRGAADTMIALEMDEHKNILLSCNKQKDAPDFPAMRLRLKSVNLPVPEDWDLRTSCVVVPVGHECRQAALKALAQSDDGLAFTRLIKLIQEGAGVSAATAKRALAELLDDAAITKADGLYFAGTKA